MVARIGSGTDTRSGISKHIGAVIVVAITAGCGGSNPDASSTTSVTKTVAAATTSSVPPTTARPQAEVITVYSGQHEQTVTELVRLFESQTGIAVDLRSAEEGSLVNQLLREGSKSPADVIFAENPPALTLLEENGLLAPTKPSTLALVDPKHNPRSGRWVAVSARAVGFVYNSEKRSANSMPDSVLDLVKPSWKGKLGLAPAETDFVPLVLTMIKTQGMDGARRWLEGMKANSTIYDSSESLAMAVNRGEVEAGIIDHYYFYRLNEELKENEATGGVQSELHYFAKGDPGSLTDVSGAATIASSKHAEAAQKFLAFLVGKIGQQTIAANESFEYPLGSGVSTMREMRPFDDFGPSPMTVEELGNGKPALQLLVEVGLL